MVYVFIANVYPVPPYPLNLITYIFLASMVGAVAWYLHLTKKHPEVIAAIGKTETDQMSGVG
jgi:hypothetical protein